MKLILSFCGLALVTALQGEEIFREEFDYFYGSQLEAVWETVTSLGGNPIGVGTDEAIETAPYANIGNAIIETVLPESIEEDWTLSFDMLHTKAARDAWVGLFDESGTNGYTAIWRSGPPGTEGVNQGVV
ncbi:MAG: hypothetical protein ACQKBT_01820, partial [Puniceicoccales bacterium]